ncbi:QWRF motif-containing protein 7 [Sesamum alatum]|uniref:QWRF motif-containing protein 7 n=1 Tax=Sesamum alatum TaxID=300844 RepID=A0AAE2CRA7_9LAMI|nr:QWRF motif-containing protein 7 [Sesamum alatum]
MEKSQYRRHQHVAARGGDSPRLFRSKSGSTAVEFSSPPETSTFTSKYSRSSKRVEISRTSAKKTQRKQEAADAGEDGGLVRFMPRSMSKIEVPRRTRSASTSPSAWALSPGRSLPCSSPAPVAVAPVPKSPASYEKLMKQESKGGVDGVLKYFRQKKVSPLLEEEYRRFRVVYNRLLQWRFANARAEASMAAVNRVAQKKLLNGWARICVIRNLMMEKRALIQKLKHQLKLYHVINSEMRLLNEWSRLEPKNVEAVGRVVRKLSAISLCLPLVQNAEGDVMSVYDAMSMAMGVMEGMEAMILDMHWQVERTCYLLTELSVMLKQQQQFFEELEKRVSIVASLEVQEKSLRVHHIQLVKEVNG